MPFQPALDFRGLVRPVVIQHQVQFLVPGKVPVQAAQEPQEFLMAMPATALSDDFASNTLSAAKSVAVPFRLSSCVIVPHRPFFRGRPGWVRSKAWIWLFHPRTTRSPSAVGSNTDPPHRSISR